MDLLHAQFNNGHLSLEEIKTCLGSDFGSSWPTLQKKFQKDEQGLFFNERLDFEKTKRIDYCSSRKNNRSQQEHMSPHMENENESIYSELKIKKESFKKEVYHAGELIYTKKMLDNFVAKWTETSRSKVPKMKFEKEKTFEISLRLATWARNNFDKIACYLTDIEKTVKQKQQALTAAMEPFRGKYTSDVMNSFYRHWSMPENKPEPQRIRWELEEFWDLAKRLASWESSPLNKGKKDEKMFYQIPK